MLIRLAFSCCVLTLSGLADARAADRPAHSYKPLTSKQWAGAASYASAGFGWMHNPTPPPAELPAEEAYEPAQDVTTPLRDVVGSIPQTDEPALQSVIDGGIGMATLSAPDGLDKAWFERLRGFRYDLAAQGGQSQVSLPFDFLGVSRLNPRKTILIEPNIK